MKRIIIFSMTSRTSNLISNWPCNFLDVSTQVRIWPLHRTLLAPFLSFSSYLSSFCFDVPNRLNDYLPHLFFSYFTIFFQGGFHLRLAVLSIMYCIAAPGTCLFSADFVLQSKLLILVEGEYILWQFLKDGNFRVWNNFYWLFCILKCAATSFLLF